MSEVRVGPLPLAPARLGLESTPWELRFHSQGLAGVQARIGLLPPDSAARQEVAHDNPGQPLDPRALWVDLELGADGEQRVEIPGPGPLWHADRGVVVVELRRGTSRLAVTRGPRSEMLSDGTRSPGGRGILASLPVTRRPTRVGAVASSSIEVDGHLKEAVWQREPAQLLLSRTGALALDFNEAMGGPTQLWFAWDATYLYVAAQIPDPDLFAPHRRRDSPLYRHEALEVFIAADNSGERYLEHELSARNVQFDSAFVRYRKGDLAWDGAWRSAVQVEGSLKGRGGDQGWSAELAFPWAQLCEKTALSCPPRAGKELRINVFRLDKPDRNTQVALALSPTGAPDFHAWENAAQLVLEGAAP